MDSNPFPSQNGKKLGVSSCGPQEPRKSLPYENPNEGILYYSRLGGAPPSGE